MGCSLCCPSFLLLLKPLLAMLMSSASPISVSWATELLVLLWPRVFFGGMSTGECQACRREQRTLDRMPHEWQRALFKLTLAKHPVPKMSDHRKISMGYRVMTGVALFTYVAGSSFYIVKQGSVQVYRRSSAEGPEVLIDTLA